MLIDLDCINDASYNCYQAVLITVANYYKTGYQMMSIGKWCFHYKKGKEDRIGNAIEPNYGRDIIGYSFFHGIDLAINNSEKLNINAESFLRILRENRPIIIHCDLYTCQWFKAYGKYHMPHYYIIYGFLEESGKFVCMDPFLNEKYIECDGDYLIKNMIDYRVASVRNVLINADTVMSELLNDVEFYDEDETYNNIAQFAIDVRDNMDIDAELGGYNTDFYAVPLLDNIKAITLYRKSYMLMLNYIEGLYSVDLSQVINKAKECIAGWELARVALMKVFVSGNRSLLEKVTMRINRVNEVEREMFDILRGCCDKYAMVN